LSVHSIGIESVDILVDIFVVEGVLGQIFDVKNGVIVWQGWSFKRESCYL
jgi:hypothetical protein